jgi:hypothetical protein
MGFQDSPYLTTPGAYAPSNPGFVPAMQMAQQTFQNGLKDFGSGMEALAEGIKQHKQNVQDAAAADTTFNMLVPQLKQSGVAIDPDVLGKFPSSSLSQKKGMIGAMSMQYAQALKTKQEQAQTDVAQARAQMLTQGMQEKQDTDAGMGVLMQQVAQVKQANPDLDNNAALLQAFQNTQAMPLHPRVQAVLAKQLFGQFSGLDAVNSEPKAFTGPNGETLFYQPGTKNPLMMSPYSKAGAQSQAYQSEVMDSKPSEEEIPAGHIALRKGKGWVVQEDPSQWRTVTALGADGMSRTVTKEFIGKPKENTMAGGGGVQPNVTQDQYQSLKPGESYWWNGKQLTKQ